MIVQVSSGSSGRPPRVVRRTLDDILDIHARVLGAWSERYPEPPVRVALLGGISHAQAAMNLRLRGTRFVSFSLDAREALRAYEPDFISCYPSVLRDLLEWPDFPGLKAVKVGGEHLLPSDVKKLSRRYPNCLLIEQLGSTEMPCLAIGAPGKLRLQRDRYSFRLAPHEDWQPLVARDEFPTSRTDFVDTGDEVRVRADQVLQVRRKDDPAFPYLGLLDALLSAGCTQVQLNEEDLVRGAPFRLPHSNKLPLVRQGRPLALPTR